MCIIYVFPSQKYIENISESSTICQNMFDTKGQYEYQNSGFMKKNNNTKKSKQKLHSFIQKTLKKKLSILFHNILKIRGKRVDFFLLGANFSKVSVFQFLFFAKLDSKYFSKNEQG